MRIVLIIVALSLTAIGSGTASAAEQPTVRVAIALDGLPWSGGVLGSDAITLAVGFDAEVARALTRRLGVRPVFVRVPRDGLGRSGGWDLAIGATRGAAVLAGDHVVVTAPGVTRPRSVADLRGRIVCARRATRAADALAALRAPARMLAGSQTELARLVRTGRCDIALTDAGDAARLGGSPVARLESRVSYGIVASAGSGLAPRVEQEIAALQRSGTLGRLARTWFGVDPARLPRLR